MSLTKNIRLMSSAMAVIVIVALAGSASAAELATQGSAQVASELAEFKRTASQMRDKADSLNSFTPNRQLSWQTHSESLNALKDHVNEMGQSLTELEALKPTANETQVLAIEHARPHLVSIARNLTEAIGLVNESRSNVYWVDYAEAVSDVYAHADTLHAKIDAILDFEKAKARLEDLELQPDLLGQS